MTKFFDLVQSVFRLFFLGLFISLSVMLVVIGTIYFENNQADGISKNSHVLGVQVASALEGASVSDNEERVDTKIVTDDARPLLIKKYLEKYKSPLLPYSDLIFELSETYGFDYYWIVAIAQQESNLCKKIPTDSYNCWGYGIHKKGTLRFENYELALRSYAEYLKREYFDKGRNTPELIMQKYCPSSNGSWAAGVSQFIAEIENGEI